MIPRALGFAQCLKRPRPGIFFRKEEDGDAAGASSAVSLISSLRISRSTREASPLGQLDLDVNASCQIELHQSVDRLRRWLDDVEQALVGADFELLARLFVDVRPSVDAELVDVRRQRNGTADQRTRALCRVGDVAGRLIEHTMIECLQTNTNILRFHVHYRCERATPTFMGL